MKDIETGADKLVELINAEKRISVEDAAKKLGISKIVIQEWANFLEEEKIISIDYKFSKTFLIERKLNDNEIKQKKKEYSSEKDAFVRKVESSLKTLESDSLGLEKIKKEFDTLKKDIGEQIGKVSQEVKDLEKYEYLKKNLDIEIQKQVSEFHSIIDKAHKDLDIEEKKHSELVEKLEIEKREAKVKEHRLLTLEEKEEELMKRINSILYASKDISNKISNERDSLKESENRAIEFESTISKIEKNIINKKKSLQPILEKAKRHEESIIKLQNDILTKAKEKTSAIKSQVEEGVKAKDKFKKFFDKKTKVEELIKRIEDEKRELDESFKKLEKKAFAFDLSTKSKTVSSQVKDLEKDYVDINKKKNILKLDFEKLTKLIKG